MAGSFIWARKNVRESQTCAGVASVGRVDPPSARNHACAEPLTHAKSSRTPTKSATIHGAPRPKALSMSVSHKNIFFDKKMPAVSFGVTSGASAKT